jgi:uncharacterized membrane protein
LPISAVDAISPAIEHTRRQLLQPFRFGQWMRLALVGLLAGELSSGGGCNTPRMPGAGHTGAGQIPSLGGFDPALFAGLIALLILSAFVLGIVFMYISSVMRFILFDSVLAKECHIRDGWNARQGPGWRYFLWKLLYALATIAALIILIGVPVVFAFALGWITTPKEHVVPLVLAGIALFLAFALFIIAVAVIYVLTKDFVIPQMALENIGAFEGWQRLWPMIKAEKSSYAGYVGMKILLAIAASIILGIVGLILALIILIPAAGVAVGAIFAGKAAGLGWTAGTITLAIVAGCVLVAVFLFIAALISVPAIVFFPAYSIYFFAGRYPALGAVLYPAPPVPQSPPVIVPPPYQPPPLPPEPIG